MAKWFLPQLRIRVSRSHAAGEPHPSPERRRIQQHHHFSRGSPQRRRAAPALSSDHVLRMSHAGQNKKVATASAHADFAFATNHCRSERASCTRSLMDLAEKTTLATGFVKLHGEQNDVEIPKRLLEFFKSGECWKYEGKVLPKAELPGFGPGSFRPTLVPPSWGV